MSAFDKIIGYDHIKAELMQISDMIHHPEVYAALDAKLPQGLLLSGAPGLGKTLMATALMEDSGLPCFTVRRSQSEDEFLKQLAHTFDEAAEAAPTMLLLDDMDKFSSDEFSTAAFTAVQSCIDKVQEKQVFVIATVNNVKELPDSLLRCGRFDRQIEVQRPNCTDGEQIIRRAHVNLGMAVALDAGLIVPVIRDADLLSLEALSAKAKDLAERARANQLGADEYKGSTFTVSNLGMFGVESFTPIINQPDAAILGVNCTEDELVMEDDGTIAKHQVLRISLTFDHRLLDGAVAAKFEMTVRDLLEHPMDILL